MTAIAVSDEVRDALADGRPVVALESTIFSRLGLPAPRNADALEACLAAVRDGGAVPALTAVLDGTPTVGVPEDAHELVLGCDEKVARRDLPVAATAGSTGVTTVSATLTLAARTGIEVFATGGIGGVHRADERTHDVSADLQALADHPVVTVSAGAKVLLDLAATLEVLETLSVPVLGLGTDEFPAFHAISSGLPVQRRIEHAHQAADALRARRAIGDPGGVLLAVPVPHGDALPIDEVEDAVVAAHEAVRDDEVRGADLTPFVLDRLAATLGARAVDANISLAVNNARVAVEVARSLAEG